MDIEITLLGKYFNLKLIVNIQINNGHRNYITEKITQSFNNVILLLSESYT